MSGTQSSRWMDVINKENKWKRRMRNDAAGKGMVTMNTLCKQDGDVKDEDNKSKSSANKNKMNHMWKAIQYTVAKIKNKIQYTVANIKNNKRSDFYKQQEEDMSMKSSTTREGNDIAGEEILSSSVKTSSSRCGNTYFSKQDKDEQQNTTPIVMKHEEQQNTTPIVMKHQMRNDAAEEILSSSVKTSSSGCGNTYLPEDIIFNILSCTCVTSLLRCKSVCKLWQSIISKPEFMKAHHLNSLNKLPSIMMITSRTNDDGGCCGATIVYPNSPKQHSVNVPLMPPFDDLEFIGSFNGVVCVFNYVHGDIYLLNPLTKMSKKLLIPRDAPLNRSERPCLTKKVDVAFGFDCVSHDSKVLWIEYQVTPTYSMDVAAVKLYSTNSDSWSKIEVGIQLPSLLHHPFCPVMWSGPVVNGVLYLEAVNAIITFDLHDELFGLISYPSFIHTRKSSVFDFEGSVAVVLETVPDGSLDEKEIGLWTPVAVSDKVAWNKMFTFDSGSEEIDWVFLYSGANQFFGKTRLGEMLYDYKKKQTNYVGLPSQTFLARVLNHAESFISVEGFEGVKDS